VHKNKKFEIESGFSVFVTSPDGDQVRGDAYKGARSEV
jgi:hypothetical protein